MGNRKIVFSHRRAVGDALMFTSGVRDFKLLFPEIEINVENNFSDLWQHNPYLTHYIKRGNPGVEFYKVGYPIINNANAANTHFTQGFLFDMIAAADRHKPLPIRLYELFSAFSNGRVGDPDLNVQELVKYRTKKEGGLKNLPENLQKLYENHEAFCAVFGRQRGDLHLSQEERTENMIRNIYGVEKYWVIAPGGKRDCTCKIWDWRRFQEVINHFKGKIQFVSIGRSDHLLERLDGVIDLTDKYNSNLRGLIPLVYHAEGCVSGVSLLMHLAAAVPPKQKKTRKPCVSIYGGREPVTFTAYNTHQILHTNGALTCCDVGGCWHSRVTPLQKDPDKNRRLCTHPVERDGRTIPQCMNIITAADVIRAIEIYYEGNIYKSLMPVTRPITPTVKTTAIRKIRSNGKELNFLASMKSPGGGEQSAAHIVKLLRDAGWTVHFHPFAAVHKKYSNLDIDARSFMQNKGNDFKRDIPLVFYGNDQVWDFKEYGSDLIDNSSAIILGINFMNGPIPGWTQLAATKKLKAVIFQNSEKRDEFARDAIGFEDTQLISLFGAIDLETFYAVKPVERVANGPMVVLKHCVSDYRKYVTANSVNKGDKIHTWQKQFIKEKDTEFYARLLSGVKNVSFEFMEAHKELVDHFKDEPRMVFHKWDSMPVPEFLSRGHVYLYRTSNKWRDQYPRVVAEALAAGLPVLTEPRDGTKDRVEHGDTGFHCVHFDEYLLALRTFRRKEKARKAMGMNAKEWAKKNLDPRRWVSIIEEILL